MKKILSLVLALVMILSVGMLASCSSDKDSGAKGTDTATGTAADEAGKKTLKMATNAYFPPYEYYDGDKIVGIDADIAQAIADKLGMELVIEDMEFNSIISAVQSGNVDFGMAGMTVTEDRLKNVDFSESYATGVQVVIVKADSDYQKPEDLTGKKVGVQLATTGDIYASASVEEGGYGEENVEKFSKGADAIIALKQDKIDAANVTQYNNGSLAVEALVNGQIDAVIIDNEPAKEFVKANDGLRILDTEYTTEDYAMAFAKGNTEMIDKVNGALKELIADGTVQKIIDKYIKAD